jgi:hypothetical protein
MNKLHLVIFVFAFAVAAFGSSPPSFAELKKSDLEYLMRQAEFCGRYEAKDPVCGGPGAFPRSFRSEFLRGAKKRRASLKQLKDLNWSWQTGFDEMEEKLAVKYIRCGGKPDNKPSVLALRCAWRE